MEYCNNNCNGEGMIIFGDFLDLLCHYHTHKGTVQTLQCKQKAMWIDLHVYKRTSYTEHS